MNVVEPIRSKTELRKIEKILKRRNFRYYVFFVLGINSGLRISDILNLDVKDVKDKTYINITEKKTSKHKRFPINSKLKPLLEKLTRDRHNEEPLFMSIFGNRMERTQCYRIINDACKEAGVDYKVGTHTLRKTFGYHFYQERRDVALLQKIFNHSSQEITLRYIGISQDIIDNSYTNFVL